MGEITRSRKACFLWRAAVLTGISLAVVGLYCWIAGPAISQLPGSDRAQTAYYNRLVDGFRAGHLHLAGDPPAELVQLTNPYDPVQNAPYRLHDATYYRGRYYLYFGVTPALVLFWPYLAITGEYLWHRQAVALFGAGLFLGSVLLLVAVWRRYYAKVGLTTVGLAVVGLGFVNTVPILLRRPDVWEVPIACAALLVMMALAALWRSFHGEKTRWGWTLAASLAYGLAVGARPSILPAAVILLFPACRTWGPTGSERRAAVAQAVAAVLPMVLIGLGLLGYNWLRFDDPFQFGQKYQLAGVDNTHARLFGAGTLGYNLRLYFWEPVRWSSYFPFVIGSPPPPAPAGHLGVESMFGLLTNTPFVWLALGTVGVFRDVRPERGPLRWFVAAAWTYAAAAGLTVCLFGGACNRYFVDFLPPAVLAAGIGTLALSDRLASTSVWVRGLGRIGFLGALVMSVAFIFFASCEHLGLLRRLAPDTYVRMARACNRLVAGIEGGLKQEPGLCELTVTFPPYQQPKMEPLLVTGTPREADYFWVQYLGPGRLRFGFEHTSYGGPVTEPLEYEPGKPYRIVLLMRALFPPKEHPHWEKDPSGRASFQGNELALWFDGKPVLQTRMDCYEASPLNRYVGMSPFARDFGGKFTGEVLAQATLVPQAAAGAIRMDGPLRCLLRLTPAWQPGLAEPLLQTGETGRADTLWLKHVDVGHVKLGLDHWSYGGAETPPLPVDRQTMQLLEIEIGSQSATTTAQGLSVTLNGRAVITAPEQPLYAVQKVPWSVGANPAGASTAVAKAASQLLVLRKD